ncbi:MAG: hypothetical protein ACRD0L_03295 [Acidimicrobiales bacterium]
MLEVGRQAPPPGRTVIRGRRRTVAAPARGAAPVSPTRAATPAAPVSPARAALRWPPVRWPAEALLAGVLALAVALPLATWGPPGVDLAAHAYQVHVWTAHAGPGIPLWDNYWYAGGYHWLTYSVLWAPLASVAGILPLGIASVVVGALAFGAVVGRTWGRDARWSSRAFGLAWPAMVTSAAYPFLLGAALALLGLWALAAWRFADGWGSWRCGSAWSFCVSALLALAASPLAFLGLAMVVAAAALARGRRWTAARRPLVVLAVLALAAALLSRAFPGYGRYPFWAADLLEILGLCAVGALLAWRAPRARALLVGSVAYAAVSLVAFLVPSEVGANLARLRFAAVPVVALAAGLRGWRPRGACVAALVAAGLWGLPPTVVVLVGDGTAAGAGAAYWQPAVAYLHAHLLPSYRVEAVDTTGHWAADHLAGAGIPLVRGWFRQDDFPADAILYRHQPLSPDAYLAWLRGLGVAYVVRTDGPPDFSSAAESRLLAGGASGLPVALRVPHLTIYAVPHPRPIVTGPAPAQVLSLQRTALVVRVTGPGTYHVAVHWTPYWRPSSGCVTRATDGMTTLVAPGPEVIRLGFHVSPGRLLATIVGRPPPDC